MDGLLDFLHDLLPASWFDSAQDHFGDGLTDEVVAQSVHEASVFFGMDDPINVHEDWTTGVMTNMSWTENDDVLIFSRDQMAEMGITDKEGFDLVMTHEGLTVCSRTCISRQDLTRTRRNSVATIWQVYVPD